MWRAHGTAALARFRIAGELATVCALVGGRDHHSDACALEELERRGLTDAVTGDRESGGGRISDARLA
jgi:hypothetical protein